MAEQELRYTVLNYEDELGTWMKIPEFDLQCLTDDPEAGLDLVEEDLRFQLELRRRKGSSCPSGRPAPCAASADASTGPRSSRSRRGVVWPISSGAGRPPAPQ